ncbi:MAG: phage tail sheath family protein, partial [Bryobacterales bacterium]|nr:phage tail sheath family protein [Bryobacterales bacterium]
MPITPTYPGLYIEELASNARTITAAPTSIAVFAGYTHPKTKNFRKAVQLFSFTEYEREFGGLYASG